MISLPVFCEEFIGRNAELGFLLERYRKAAAGQGSLVLIAGEAGIGKTRLIAELRKALSDEDPHFLSGHCFEFGRSPYLPFEEATGDYFGGARPGNNLFAETIVCLDAKTGKRQAHGRSQSDPRSIRH